MSAGNHISSASEEILTTESDSSQHCKMDDPSAVTNTSTVEVEELHSLSDTSTVDSSWSKVRACALCQNEKVFTYS